MAASLQRQQTLRSAHLERKLGRKKVVDLRGKGVEGGFAPVAKAAVQAGQLRLHLRLVLPGRAPPKKVSAAAGGGAHLQRNDAGLAHPADVCAGLEHAALRALDVDLDVIELRNLKHGRHVRNAVGRDARLVALSLPEHLRAQQAGGRS